MSHDPNSALKALVERIERIEEEIKAGNDDKRDIYAEAKSSGYDVAALKAVVARRRKDPSKLTELEALVQTYEAALGTHVATRAHVHAHDPAPSVASAAPSYAPMPVSEDAPTQQPSPSIADAVASDDLDIPGYLRRAKVSA